MQREKIIPINIEEEMKDSYLDYSMSVIVSRALPDVRDGLKPVHRRVLYGMNDMGLQHNKPYKKSARIVGDVMGKYHPHGDAAIYDTMVRMVQDFSLRYPLVDGQGNFGSIDGDGAAAMRYTEARMAEIAEEILADIEKDTVGFVPNYDDTLKEPSVLPAKLPNLLVNGASGIAVGMATNIPPHNLSEIVDGIVTLIDNPDITADGLMNYIIAPDFPTGGIIYGKRGVRDAYETGRGRVVIRARASVEALKGGRDRIVISEVPYQVNKARLIEKIAELIKEKVITGVSEIRDESDRDGMRVVMELKREGVPEVILNQIYQHTQAQSTFGVIMLGLMDGQPRVLNLKEMLQAFIDHRHEVVLRRTKFDLEKARERAHILEGLKIAVDNIDEIVALIKGSKNPEEARVGLMVRFKLSEVQARAILDMRLQRLTGLERRKLVDELRALSELIVELSNILESKELQLGIIKDELAEMKEKYGDGRRSEVVETTEEFSIEDMIAEEDMVITISHRGFIKRFPVSGFRRQQRGGKGSTGAGTVEEDFIEHMFVASTHHYILFFTDKGRCYWLKVHQIPQAGKASKGRAIVNLLEKQPEEKIAAFVTVREFNPELFVVMATRRGIVKKTPLVDYSHPRRGGINAITIRPDDQLIEARITDGTNDIILGTRGGKAIRFHESDVRSMGRTAAGVQGVKVSGEDAVVGMVIIKRDSTILVVTEKGYGKRTGVKDYRITHRGGKGIITIKTTPKVGRMVAIKEVVDDDDLMIITAAGILIRQHVGRIKVIGRNTQGARLINLREEDEIGDVARVVRQEEMEEESPEEYVGSEETETGKT
ncbi:DNA gyrase subunit A [candidate division KSB1 bacterium]|nr:DNA gyrase subunit A [candidate division KSB1 bacterium]